MLSLDATPAGWSCSLDLGIASLSICTIAIVLSSSAASVTGTRPKISLTLNLLVARGYWACLATDWRGT